MPLYDFRCADCAAEREVRASFREASSLELICTGCGGSMTRTVSRTAPVVLTAPSGTASAGKQAAGLPGAGRPRTGTGTGTGAGRRGARARTCEDGAVRLTRPNPFAAALPGHQAAENGAQG